MIKLKIKTESSSTTVLLKIVNLLSKKAREIDTEVLFYENIDNFFKDYEIKKDLLCSQKDYQELYLYTLQEAEIDGAFLDSTGKVIVLTEGRDIFELISTLVHEVRHSYQYLYFRERYEMENGKFVEIGNDRKKYLDYIGLWVEKDARRHTALFIIRNFMKIVLILKGELGQKNCAAGLIREVRNCIFAA